MGVGEAGAVKGDKPQAHADKSPSAESVKEFNEALGRSAGSASSTQAAAGTAAGASGGKLRCSGSRPGRYPVCQQSAVHALPHAGTRHGAGPEHAHRRRDRDR